MRREIRRTETLLRERISDPAIDMVALYGALDAEVQDRAIAPAPAGRRKIVLATSIAETSLTIEGVRIVVDCGLARVPRYEPDVGLTRLETVRVSRASADQRRGRAGRTEPGVCYRLWDEPQTASLEPANAAGNSCGRSFVGFVLDLAHWGVTDPATLAFLDPPPRAALNEAQALLTELGAIDRDGRITEEGQQLRRLPLPPRLARMVVDAGERETPRSPPRSRSCSPSAASAATMSILRIASMSCAATARAARKMRARWRSAGRQPSKCGQGRRQASAIGRHQ